MAENSKIEWTEATWNPVVGCARVSAGCDHCYAVTMTHRLEAMGQPKYAGLTVLNGRGERHFNGVVRCDEDALAIPLKRRKPTVYFVNSMSDLFHKDVPFEFIDRVFAVMALCPQHTFQVLTKRPERMAEYLTEGDLLARLGWKCGLIAADQNPNTMIAGDELTQDWADGKGWPLPNVWLGTSAENQAAADERIPRLLKCPAAVRFLSLEPFLGDIDLTGQFLLQRATGVRQVSKGQMPWDAPLMKHPEIHWVIVGGERKGARTCEIDWIRGIVSQCKAAGVPCFVKQLGRSFLLRNDRISDWPRDGDGLIDVDWYPDQEVYQGDLAEFRLNDPKGGDPSEWPKDLRVREMPKVSP